MVGLVQKMPACHLNLDERLVKQDEVSNSERTKASCHESTIITELKNLKVKYCAERRKGDTENEL